MNILESFEELIDRTKTWFDENERVAEEQIERIENQIDELRDNIEHQIEELENQQHQKIEDTEEQIEKLNEELDAHHRITEEQMEKMQEESEEKERSIQEQIEKCENELERSQEYHDERIEKLREQFEHKEEIAKQQIDKIREQIDEFRDKANEHVESINQQIQNHKENFETVIESIHSKNMHVTTTVSSETPNNQISVQSLIDIYDEEYNDRHENTSISNTYVINGVEILKYGGKLISLEKMDSSFPRNEWLQNLLDQGVRIQNIEEYCHYLNARDMLLRIQEKPNVWTSGLFDIPPTENWDTYKVGYMKWLSKQK